MSISAHFCLLAGVLMGRKWVDGREIDKFLSGLQLGYVAEGKQCLVMDKYPSALAIAGGPMGRGNSKLEKLRQL